MLRKQITSCVYLAIAGAALSLPLLAQPCFARTLQLEDYLKWEFVRNPQISPDGKTILYARSRVNAAEDRIDSEWWATNSDGSDNRRLMHGVSEVRWSPDSTRIAYLDDTERGPEIFVRRMDRLPGGGLQHITMINLPIFGAMSPASFRDAIVAAKPDPKTGKPDPEKLKADAASHPDAMALAQYTSRHTPTANYYQSAYFSVYTFRFIDAKGSSTW